MPPGSMTTEEIFDACGLLSEDHVKVQGLWDCKGSFGIYGLV